MAKNTTTETTKKVEKKRNWAFVVYPDSAPENWLDILTQTGLEIAISPLHDKDVNPTGEPKKPHYHVIACYNGPTSFNVVKKLTDQLNAPIPIPLEAVKGYYRYLTHKDNPEKYQYDEKDIKTLNGFNIANFSELTRGEVLELKKNIHTYIREHDIKEYCDLLDMLFDDSMFNEYDIATNHTLLFSTYIKSRKFKERDLITNDRQYI